MRRSWTLSLLLGAGLVLASAWTAYASVTADILSLTLTAQSLPNLNLPPISTADLTLLPFYLRVNYPPSNEGNWGLAIYSDNRKVMGSATTPDGLYRGLRGSVNPADHAPLLWQVYPYDQDVASSWGSANSVTSTPGALGLYESTLIYWGTVVDRSDADQVARWDETVEERLVVNADHLGKYPLMGRGELAPPVYLYFGLDVRGLRTNQPFIGNLTLEYYHSGFDYSKGGFATPNPVKPALGQKVFFNFFTNNADSQIVIRLYDLAGNQVNTLHGTRYWDCRNTLGHWVEGGLYLYQIESEGHLISGTVVVIK